MTTLFGSRDDFAIEAGINASSAASRTVWGHMCVWCRGAPLGDIDDAHCAIGIARARFQRLITPVDGQLVIDCLWSEVLAGLDPPAVWRLLRALIRCRDDDGNWLEVANPPQPPPALNTWSDLDFLTNWGEQFDGYASFILRPPGDSVRILSRRFPAGMGLAADVSRDTFIAAVVAFCDWFDERDREHARACEEAVARWSPSPPGTPWFPDEALAYLRSASFQETAFPCLEVTSRSLFWSDEAFLEFAAVCHDRGSPWSRTPLVYRSSLIRGQPDEIGRAAWDELRRLCPQWPGFMPERCSPTLRAELERQIAGLDAS